MAECESFSICRLKMHICRLKTAICKLQMLIRSLQIYFFSGFAKVLDGASKVLRMAFVVFLLGCLPPNVNKIFAFFAKTKEMSYICMTKNKDGDYF